MARLFFEGHEIKIELLKCPICNSNDVNVNITNEFGNTLLTYRCKGCKGSKIKEEIINQINP